MKTGNYTEINDDNYQCTINCACGMVHRIGRRYPDPYKLYIYDEVEVTMLEAENNDIYHRDLYCRGKFWAYECVNCGRIYVFRYDSNVPEKVLKEEN